MTGLHAESDAEAARDLLARALWETEPEPWRHVGRAFDLLGGSPDETRPTGPPSGVLEARRQIAKAYNPHVSQPWDRLERAYEALEREVE